MASSRPSIFRFTLSDSSGETIYQSTFDPPQTKPGSAWSTPDMASPVQIFDRRTNNRSFVIFISIFYTAAGLAFILHFAGVTAKSYANFYTGNGTLTSPLQCRCGQGDNCTTSKLLDTSYLTCNPKEICGTSVDHQGYVTKGCIINDQKICEYIFTSDFGAMRPKFRSHCHNGVNRYEMCDKMIEVSKVYHVCYCRHKFCNKGSQCQCVHKGTK